MNFQQQLQQEMQRMERKGNFGDNEVEYPNSKLKNKELFFSKDNNQYTVRVLPPKSDDAFFAKQVKEIWLNKTNKNGKEIKINAVLPYAPAQGESILTEALAEWQNQQRVPNNFSRTASPRKLYYVNVVQVAMGQDGNMVMERDANGDLAVRLMKLPQSAYSALVAKISDPMFTPQNSGEYGLIGISNAYPVRITKPAPGGMSYTVDVFQKDLGALPENWKDLLEDLDYQATPTEVYNRDLVEYFINLVNGNENQNTNNSGGNNGGGFNQTNQPQQGFTQQQSFNQPSQPQQQQSFNQPQQSFNQPQQGFTQQQSFNQPSQPQQGFSAEPSFSQPVDTGDSNPFNTSFENNMPTNFNAMPDVSNNNASIGNQPEPQQQQPEPPMQSQSQPQDVNDVLAQMRQNIGK